MPFANPFSQAWSAVFGFKAPTVPPAPVALTAPPPSAPTIITPVGGTLTDADGNVWSISFTGAIIRNNKRVPGGSGMQAATLVNNVLWAKDGETHMWYAYDKGWHVSYGAPPGVYG